MRPSSRDILTEGLRDWVDLGFARQYVSDEVGEVSPTELREQTIQVVADLLAAGLFVAGDLHGGFTSWCLEPAATTARISAEWTVPDAPLRPGDICWLQITDAGRTLAERLLRVDPRPAP